MEILYTNTIDFNYELQQRPMHLLKELANRGHKVYWVNKTHTPNKIKERHCNGNLFVYHDWEVFKKRFKNHTFDVFYASWALRYQDLEDINANFILYDSLDNFSDWEKYEDLMLKEANAVLCASKPLYDIRKEQHNNVYLCRNACFPEFGDKFKSKPTDLKGFRRPIVLFSGALAYWIDLDLFRKVTEITDWTTIVVGNNNYGLPEDKKKKLKHLYLGVKSYDSLQYYYNNADVTLLPFNKSHQAAYYSNPIKTYESLVFGKQVVATDIPEALEYKDQGVLIGENHTQYINNIYKALDRRNNIETIEKCKKIAEENSWYKRVDLIEEILEKEAK